MDSMRVFDTSSWAKLCHGFGSEGCESPLCFYGGCRRKKFSIRPSWSTVDLQRKVSVAVCSGLCSRYLLMLIQGLACLRSREEAIFYLRHVTNYWLGFLQLQVCELCSPLQQFCDISVSLLNGNDMYVMGHDLRFSYLTSIIRWEILENHWILNEDVFAVEGRGLLASPCSLCNKV